MFPVPTTDLDACSTFTFTVMTSDVDSTPVAALGAPVVETDAFGTNFVKIAPLDTTYAQTVYFWVYVEALGGASTFLGEHKINLNCNEFTSTVITESAFTSQTFELSYIDIPVFYFDEYGNSALCQTDYYIVDSNGDEVAWVDSITLMDSDTHEV